MKKTILVISAVIIAVSCIVIMLYAEEEKSFTNPIEQFQNVMKEKMIETMILNGLAQTYYENHNKWPKNVKELQALYEEKKDLLPDDMKSQKINWDKYADAVFNKLPDGSLELLYEDKTELLGQNINVNINSTGNIAYLKQQLVDENNQINKEKAEQMILELMKKSEQKDKTSGGKSRIVIPLPDKKA